jgi:tetratricopeptide (TPR) repeat protein
MSGYHPPMLSRLGAGIHAAALLALVLTGSDSAWAQAPAKPREPQAQSQRPAQDRHPRPNKPRTQDLEFLFGALKAAPSAESAKAVENRILAQWVVSGSDTADLLMTRVKSAIDAKELDLAAAILDSVVDLRPDYVEAWNRRATVRFMQKDLAGSLADIRQVLAREPRHFGALAGLGMILQDVGEEKWALLAFRRALELHPHLPRIGELMKGLAEKVEGRGI